MAIRHSNSTVRTTATALVTVGSGPHNIPVFIQNNDVAAIYVGDATVTTSGATGGFKVNAGANLQIWGNAGDTIYAVSALGTAANAVVVIYSN